MESLGGLAWPFTPPALRQARPAAPDPDAIPIPAREASTRAGRCCNHRKRSRATNCYSPVIMPTKGISPVAKPLADATLKAFYLLLCKGVGVFVMQNKHADSLKQRVHHPAGNAPFGGQSEKDTGPDVSTDLSSESLVNHVGTVGRQPATYKALQMQH